MELFMALLLVCCWLLAREPSMNITKEELDLGFKKYLQLDAYDLGQIVAALDQSKVSKSLRARIKIATAQVYLDSGFTPKQVFGDQRYKKNRELKQIMEQSDEHKRLQAA